MSREALRNQLVQQGFDLKTAEEFANACTFRVTDVGQSRGPERLMETLVVGRTTGGFSYSLKPYNVLIHIPKLVTSVLTSAYGFAHSGDALALLLGAAGVVVGVSVNLTKNDAAVVLALHDLDAYLGKGRYLAEATVISKCADSCAAWSIAPIDPLKFRESVNSLRRMRTVDLRDGKIALAETVIATKG